MFIRAGSSGGAAGVSGLKGCLRGAAIAVCCLAALSACAAADTGRRFFYSGNGALHLVSDKTGDSFQGSYRTARGYDETALAQIHRVFGAEPGRPISAISLRLLEFLDFLEDRLGPGARITVVSGWRSPEYNTGLRDRGKLAAKASLHQYGMAADIVMEGVPPKGIWDCVRGLGFGGAGYYRDETVHVDVGPARSWDQNTSGVGTGISEHNKLIGLVTDFDIYAPGDPVTLRFIRMTAFPVGILPEFELLSVKDGAEPKKVAAFRPSFSVEASGDCPRFGDIGQMMGIGWRLPDPLPPGTYRIRARFCQRPWAEMPADAATPEFRVVRSR